MSVLEKDTNLYIKGIEQGDYEKASKAYMSKEYKQHSTGVKTGAEGFKEFFADFIVRFPNRKFKIIHSFKEGNLAFLMVLQKLNGVDSWITMDIFDSDENFKLKEHWDIIEEYKDDIQINGKFSFEKNSFDLKKIVEENSSDFSNFISGSYSHSLNDYEIKELEIYQILRKDNFVVILGKFLDDQEYASMNLLRFEEDKVVEYWEVIEPIPTQELAKNSGKF